MKHYSVLLQESIDALAIKEDGIYVDCTLGRGGHSSEILKRLTKGHLYCFDLDKQAIEESAVRLSKISNAFTCIHSGFETLGDVLDQEGIDKVDGILMDLGVSSPQFDDGQRGFSYRMDARLDMRMNQDQELDAYAIVNSYSKEELIRVFKDYGEEPFASRIASKIIERREQNPIETTFELVDVIKSALPQAVLNKKGHPAKRVFQAIRIEVNQELTQLAVVLKEGIKRLNTKGRFVIITFHSLEDRMVKDAFKEVSTPKKVDKRVPILDVEKIEYRMVNKKPILAGAQELQENNRSHSAKLRILEKL